MPQAFPANHDDDDGSNVWGGAIGDRFRRRRRIAPAARYLDCRRIVRKPDIDPLYDARHLPLPRPLPIVGATPLENSPPAICPRTLSRSGRMSPKGGCRGWVTGVV